MIETCWAIVITLLLNGSPIEMNWPKEIYRKQQAAVEQTVRYLKRYGGMAPWLTIAEAKLELVECPAKRPKLDSEDEEE